MFFYWKKCNVLGGVLLILLMHMGPWGRNSEKIRFVSNSTHTHTHTLNVLPLTHSYIFELLCKTSNSQGYGPSATRKRQRNSDEKERKKNVSCEWVCVCLKQLHTKTHVGNSAKIHQRFTDSSLMWVWSTHFCYLVCNFKFYAFPSLWPLSLSVSFCLTFFSVVSSELILYFVCLMFKAWYTLCFLWANHYPNDRLTVWYNRR